MCWSIGVDIFLTLTTESIGPIAAPLKVKRNLEYESSLLPLTVYEPEKLTLSTSAVAMVIELMLIPATSAKLVPVMT